jgi:hypothetical protein
MDIETSACIRVGRSCVTKFLVVLEVCDISLRLKLLKVRLLGGSDKLLSCIANFSTDRKIQVRVRTKAQNRWKFRVGCRKDRLLGP